MENNDEHHIIYCTYCIQRVWKVKATSTTSSLQLRHLRQWHGLPTTAQEEIKRIYPCQQNRQSVTAVTPFTIAQNSSAGIWKRNFDQLDNTVLREYIAQFIISTNSSLSIVENPAFQQPIQYCHPSAIMVSCRSTSCDIIALYNKLQPQIKQRL